MNGSEDHSGDVEVVRRKPAWIRVNRRGPILMPARDGGVSGLFGMDLTAGCGMACPFCHIRGSALFPGEGRIRFDPNVDRRLASILDTMPERPRTVVLSPNSDPLPPERDVRQTALRVIETLLEREVRVILMTRGRIPRAIVDGLASTEAERVSVLVGMMTADRKLARALEPWAATPIRRLDGIGRLIEAGVPTEVRLEPLIPGLTDTRENSVPLFRALERLGVRRVVVHYLFRHPSMIEPLAKALAPLQWVEKLEDAFLQGPAFPLGSLGTTKHIPVETRREGLARLCAWGAEYGLTVETGASQNPDLAGPERAAKPLPLPGRKRRQRASAEAVPVAV